MRQAQVRLVRQAGVVGSGETGEAGSGEAGSGPAGVGPDRLFQLWLL